MISNYLSLKNIFVKRGENFTLQVKRLELPENTIAGLIGNNGAGKTTLFMTILDLLDYKNGEITILGHKWSSGEYKIKAKIGVFLDETYVIDYLTLDEYFRFLAKAYGVDERITLERAIEYLNILQIEYNSAQLIRKLSRGNRIKTGLIASLLHQPDLLFWDEPFANLDPLSRQQLINLITIIKKQQRSTFLISSHNIDELYGFCDNFICLSSGKIALKGEKSVLSKKQILHILGIE